MRKMRKIGAAVLASSLLLAGSIPAYATTQEELASARAQNEQSESELQSTQDRIAELESKKGESEAYLQDLNDQLTSLTDQLTDLQKQYSDKQTQLDSISQELANAQADEAQQRGDMQVRIQYMYENSANSSALISILASDNFTDMLNAATNISELESYDRKALEQYVATCATIESKQAEVLQEQEANAQLSAQSENKKAEITEIYEETKAQVEAFADGIEDAQSVEAQLVASILAQQESIEALNRKASDEVAAAEAAAQAAANASVGTGTVDSGAAQAGWDAGSDAVAETPTQSTAAASSAENTAAAETQASRSAASQAAASASYSGTTLTRSAGRIQGPSGGETYYNLDMSGVVSIMRNMGNTDEYWVRDDGVKMLGDYVMVAANLDVHPRGSYVQSSLGMAIVCDTGGFAVNYPNNLDVATAW